MQYPHGTMNNLTRTNVDLRADRPPVDTPFRAVAVKRTVFSVRFYTNRNEMTRVSGTS